MSDDDLPGWLGDRPTRQDGLLVVGRGGTDGEQWIILPSDNRLAIKYCPCCTQPLSTARVAMLLANKVYPAQQQ